MSAFVLPQLNPTQQQRQAERRPFAATVQVRRGMMRETVEVLDISCRGARFRSLYPLPAGQSLWLRLPRIEPIEARVVWTRGCESGCEFTRSLHPAVFETIARGG